MDLQQTFDGATFWLDHDWGSVAAVLGSWRWLLGLYFFLLCGDCDWIMTLQACGVRGGRRLGVRGGRSEGLRRREGLCDSVREAGGQFCKYARGGSNKIRDRPAPGIGAIYITRNRPVTSPGRGGAGRDGSVWIGPKLPSLILDNFPHPHHLPSPLPLWLRGELR